MRLNFFKYEKILYKNIKNVHIKISIFKLYYFLNVNIQLEWWLSVHSDI